MATLAFIAKSLGLSKTTVSRAFDPRFKDKVKPETMERILEFCRKCNYHPSLTGRSFSTGKRFQIGLLSYEATDRHYGLFSPLFNRGVAETALEHGYAPVLLEFKDQDVSCIDMVNSSVADGYIASAPDTDDELLQLLTDKKTPFILYDIYNNCTEDVPVFYRDIRPAYRKLWQNLAPEYYDKTAFIWQGTNPGKWRDLLDAAPQGIKVDNIELYRRRENFLFHRESAKQESEKQLDKLLKYKLLWCCSDLTALGICDTFKAHGVEVGKDIYVVGFDNLEDNINNFTDKGLTTIDAGWKSGGSALTNILLNAITTGNPLPLRTPWVLDAIFRDTFPKTSFYSAGDRV